jgi:hypothetical protein
MPINPESKETEQEFISRCMSEEKDSFPETIQRYAVCKSIWEKDNMTTEEAQQGGVVNPGSFARTKFEYPPKSKEKLNDYMSRCMSDDIVREKKKDRGVRAGFCYTQYTQRYIANIAMGWK